jgi:hypothetical protein
VAHLRIGQADSNRYAQRERRKRQPACLPLDAGIQVKAVQRKVAQRLPDAARRQRTDLQGKNVLVRLVARERGEIDRGQVAAVDVK